MKSFEIWRVRSEWRNLTDSELRAKLMSLNGGNSLTVGIAIPIQAASIREVGEMLGVEGADLDAIRQDCEATGMWRGPEVAVIRSWNRSR